MKSGVRQVGIILIVAGGLMLLAGCMSPLEKLRAEVQRIHKDGASNDNTVGVLAVVALDNRPIKALTVMNEPKTRYMATYRFVTAVIKEVEITLYHRGITRSYPIKKRLYGPMCTPSGIWELGYITGDADTLAINLTGKYAVFEQLVVCDMQLNPIESESSFWNDQYPSLLSKYGKFSQKEYEEWLSTDTNRGDIRNQHQ